MVCRRFLGAAGIIALLAVLDGFAATATARGADARGSVRVTRTLGASGSLSRLMDRPAAARPLAPVDPAPPVYRLRVVSTQCTPRGCRSVTACCTAVAIGRHNPGKEIFLTAGHCLRGSVRSAAIEIGGRWHSAVVLGVSQRGGRDLAALGVEYRGSELACVSLAAHPPAPGEPVTLAAFPDGGGLRRRAGRVAEHGYRDVELVIDVPTRSGESGGAILDRGGRLAGIISATGPLPSPDHTLASGVADVRGFLLETFRAGVPRCDAVPPAGEPGGEPIAVRPPGGPPTVASPCAPSGGCGGADDARFQELAAEIARLRIRLERLECVQIPVQVLSPSGRVVHERRIPLGEPIQLRLVPIAPTNHIRDPPR